MSHLLSCFTPVRLAAVVLLCATASPVLAIDPDPAPAAPTIATSPEVPPDSGAILAQGAPAASPSPSAPAVAPARATLSQNLTLNLIHRLVDRGILSQEDADTLIKQAEQDTADARAQAQAQASSGTPAAPAGDGDVRVTYVPDVVKEQMREEIKEDVMAQARTENWASPKSLPSWLSRLSFFGDVRARYEGDYLPSSNSADLARNGGGSNYYNFNAINTGSPYDASNASISNRPPYVNVDQDRDRIRLRARFGVNADLGDGFSAGFRVATGQDNSPVTENQSLGYSGGGQGGDFSKYAIWLDRGFIKYEYGGNDQLDLTATVGRFDNPFFHTSMIWADDLGFDGLALQGKARVADGVTPFLTGGAFPVYNTDFNFSSNQDVKYKSEDKWLFAVQGGTDWKINNDVNFKIAAAYYLFENIEGKVSDPTPIYGPNDQADTDDSRPAFAQHGNTYIPLRDIENSPDPTVNQYQYFGLATPFHEVALTGRIDYSHFDPLHVWITGEFVNNVAFNKSAILNNGPNLFGPVNNVVGPDGSDFQGSDTGWIVGLNIGSPTLEKRWDWNVYLNYRYVGSDATVDGFADSDFGGGLAGTNLKGYTLGGTLALSSRVWAGIRWMSADSIAGPSMDCDVVQIDLNARF